MMSKRILTINECYSDNIGDQAISQAMRSFCGLIPGDIVDNCDFSFRSTFYKGDCIFSNKNSKIKRFIPLFVKKVVFASKNALKARVIAKKRYSLALIGGGQLVLSNATFSISLFLYTFFLSIYGTRIKLVSVGVGQHFTALDKYLFRLSLRFVDEVYVRDQQSLLNLKEVFSCKSTVIPDIAYFLTERISTCDKKRFSCMISPVEYHVYKRYHREVGKSFLTENEYIFEWVDSIISFSRARKAEKIYIAATTIADLKFSKLLFKHLVSNTQYACDFQLFEKVNLVEYVSLLRKCESIFSGRMHALILGHTLGLEVVPYRLSQKIDAYMREYLLYDANLFKMKLIGLRHKII